MKKRIVTFGFMAVLMITVLLGGCRPASDMLSASNNAEKETKTSSTAQTTAQTTSTVSRSADPSDTTVSDTTATAANTTTVRSTTNGVSPTASTSVQTTTQTTASTTVLPTTVATTTSTTTTTTTTAVTTTTTAVPTTTAITTTPAQTTAASTSTTAAQTTAAGSTASAMQQAVFRLVNAEREKAGLAPLAYHHAAQAAADIRAVEIKQSFSHTRPQGTTCFTALDEAGVTYFAAGENIAAGQTTPEQVMDDWMHSEGHRNNILSNNFNAIVIGFIDNHWVQLFLGA